MGCFVVMEFEQLAYNFRNAIERAKVNNEHEYFFRKFPTGQCGHTSDLLAQYYIDNGISDITYVVGTYSGDDFEDIQSHAWLVVNDMIVDITVDQFKYNKKLLYFDKSVYVGKMTSFHKMFEFYSRDMHKHYGLSKQWFNYHDLVQIYKIILSYM